MKQKGKHKNAKHEVKPKGKHKKAKHEVKSKGKHKKAKHEDMALINNGSGNTWTVVENNTRVLKRC